MFRTRTWVPGRAVPWGLGRLPRAPGAPPRGSPGGVPTLNYKGHFHLSTLRIRIKIYVDLDVDFWSFWGRSWVPLGGHFRSFWCLFRRKLVPEPSSNRLIFFQNVFVHEIIRFALLLGVWGARMATQKCSRSLQDGSLIVLDRLFLLLDFRFFCGSFLVPFLVVLGCPNAPLGVREKSANRPLGDSKMVLGSTWLGPFFVLQFGFAFFTLLGSSWGRLGAPLGLFSAVLGSLGLVLGIPEDIWEPSTSLLSPVCSSCSLLSALFPWPFSFLPISASTLFPTK